MPTTLSSSSGPTGSVASLLFLPWGACRRIRIETPQKKTPHTRSHLASPASYSQHNHRWKSKQKTKKRSIHVPKPALHRIPIGFHHACLPSSPSSLFPVPRLGCTGCKTVNVGRRLLSWYPIVSLFPKLIGYPVNGGGGPLLRGNFSEIYFFRKAHSPSSTFLWVKLVHLLTQKKSLCFEHLKTQAFPNKKMRFETLIKKTATKQFCKDVPHEWPRSSIM